MTKPTLQQARRIIRQAEESAQKAREKKSLDRNKKLIGTFWRYSNSYGSGERWWLYTKVLRSISSESLECLNIEKTCYDHIEIEVNHRGLYDSDKDLGYGYERITYKQWFDAVTPILKELDVAIHFQNTKRRLRQ